MDDTRRRQLMSAAGLVAAFVVTAVLAAPAPKVPGKSRPVQVQSKPVTSVIPTKTPVPSGTLPMPDLNLSEVRIVNQVAQGQLPNGMTCYSFGLQPVFMNIGVVATGPFKIVWERADAENGPYTVPCQMCTMIIQDAKPNVGMLPEPRVFNSCGGMKWYRVRLDPDNNLLELRKDNNSGVVHF